MKPEAPQKDLVFIASGGRTGTTFFGENLKSVIEDCWSEHEPDILYGAKLITREQLDNFGLWHMVLGRLTGQAGLRVLGHRRLIGQVDTDTFRSRILRSRRQYHENRKEPMIVESHAQWWYLAGDLPHIWPDSKLIGVIRDPRTWVRSWLNHGRRYAENDRVKLIPPGRLTPEQLGQDDYASRWSDWGAFEKLAWEWTIIYGNLQRGIFENPNGRMWRFEDLFGGDTRHVTELVEFAATHGDKTYKIGDLSSFTDHVANASKGAARDWQSWTPEQAAHVDELCGPLMAQFGYGEEPDWKALVADGYQQRTVGEVRKSA